MSPYRIPPPEEEPPRWLVLCDRLIIPFTVALFAALLWYALR